MKLYAVVSRSGTKSIPYYHACDCYATREQAQEDLEKTFWNQDYYHDVQIVEFDFHIGGETI